MSDDNPRCPKCLHRLSWCICDSKPPALPPVRSEPLLAWIVSRLTTADGTPMSVGRDTSAEIVERIQRHANAGHQILREAK